MIPSPCCLESLEVNDLPLVERLFSESKVRAFLGGSIAPSLARQRALEFVLQSERAWAVRSASGNSGLLGVVLLDRHHDLEDIEVSYLFLPEHWGRGYASAAVRQVLAHAFGTIGLCRVVAETQSANAASVRLLERLGFRLLRKVVRFGAEQSIYLAEPLSSIHAAT